MKKVETIKAAAAVIAVSVVFASCGNSGKDKDTGSERASVTTSMEVQPISGEVTVRTAAEEVKTAMVEIGGLSRESHGYGQGVQVDDSNRTLGALDFNSAHRDMNAIAIDEKSTKITLTFDQGYENGYTSKILDTLKDKNVRAVFFIVQDYAERNPELVRRMINEGHTIANHSVHHYSMPELSEEECREEIMGLHEYVKENFGVEMNLFRPPMGEYSEYSLGVTANCGYKTVLWSFAYADWDENKQPEPMAAMEKLVNAAHPGAIYLLHSVSKTNADILGDFIDAIRSEGFEIK